MKTTAIVIGALAAMVAAFAPVTALAHGDDPHDAGEAIAKALKKPLVVKGGGVLTITHVQKGCHVWAKKTGSAVGVKVLLKRGQRLTILNHDLDAHKLVRLAGPKLALGKAMRINDRVTLTFRKKGVYKLRTKKAAMPGMPEIKTTGPDNILAMVIVVR